MKSFTCHIPEETLTKLRTAITVREMAGVNVGLPELFLMRLITEIEKGNTEYTFTIKKPID
jgi:hypothetical protein